MRAFLAIEIDEKLSDKISEVQREFMKCEAAIKMVETENLHFTLKFFGEVDEDKIGQITTAIDGKIKNYEHFRIKIKGMGVFPNEKYIRVLWLGMDNFKPFSNLQRDLDEDFHKMGFKKEKSYIPHLTIGRVKGAKNKDELLATLKDMIDIEIGEMDVNKIVLKKSELTPAGPIYTNLNEFDLK